MKSTLAVVLTYFICFAYCQEKYTDKYDGMDLDEILANKRLTNAYLRCVQETGKCTPEGRYLKSHIKEALNTGCKKCTGAQQQGIRKVIKYMINKEQDIWQQLVQKYDPQGVYSTKYQNQLKEMKV